MSLYQKYRPKDFSSLFGQNFVKESLRNALKLDRTVGAYLFHGSRGTGKTTVARILAKGVNCLSLTTDGNPCGECQNCRDFEEGRFLDIIEIDAASNTGVDNIREVIEKSQFQPTQGKYKVYIVDEVHMLSKGAFNALLKTLEEPPHHVKFILATTEIHKIPDTIVSRTQRYDFKKISSPDIVDRLAYIAHHEGIDAEDAALERIARLAKWGMRDAISIFEQYAFSGVLKLSYIEENLQLIGDDFLEDLTQGIISKNYNTVSTLIASLQEKSIDTRIFIEQVLYFLKDKLVKSLNTEEFSTYRHMFDTFESAYGKLKFVLDTFLLLEVTILALVNTETVSAKHVIHETVSIPKSTPKKEEYVAPKTEEPVKAPAKKEVMEEPKIEEKVPAPAARAPGENARPFLYTELVEHIRTVPKKAFVAMSLKAASYIVDGDKLIISVDNDFNFSKLDVPEIKSFISEEIKNLFDQDFMVEVTKGWRKSNSNQNQNQKGGLASEAEDIF